MLFRGFTRQTQGSRIDHSLMNRHGKVNIGDAPQNVEALGGTAISSLGSQLQERCTRWLPTL